MDTPICDFVRQYADKKTLRLHMPGHKGQGCLGVEQLDITEISGADSLYDAEGIIKQSEDNASALFGFSTYYSTEGSSQCIRAMLYLAMMQAKQQGKKPVIAAGRNAHKAFLSAAALMDADVIWLYPNKADSYLSCNISGEELEDFLRNNSNPPFALYLTSPDYLGNVADIREIANVCHRYGVLLLVDNAHGAYMKFLDSSMHPIDLGADMCCDSAHKTLPVVTGGAYLHLSDAMAEKLSGQVKNAMALFGSTSPSYLILQSLDNANGYMDEYRKKLIDFVPKAAALKESMQGHGYHLYGSEPMKITIKTKPFGYTGGELAAILEKKNIVCEFCDPDHLVLMISPEVGETGLKYIEKVFLSIEKRKPIPENPPAFYRKEKVLSVREAAFALSETIPVWESEGRILAAATVSCPPAVPILVCGERIDKHDIACFEYYGINTCSVVCED